MLELFERLAASLTVLALLCLIMVALTPTTKPDHQPAARSAAR